MKKLLLFLLLAAGLISVSCDNFMNGSQVQDQLEKMIDVANATSCTIVVSNETTMGSFLSSGDKPCKLGYTIEVQFNVKKDQYIYKGLKALSKDTTKSMDSYVQFEVIDKDDSRGIYKTSIKLLKESNDILIVPDCTLIPAVLTNECTPDNYPNAWEQDSIISIVFNKPVITTEFFVPVITDGSGESLSSYFAESYLSADSKVLYIPVADGKQLLTEDDRAETRDVIVTIDLSTIKDEENNYGSGTIQHKYRVNKSKDTTKPEMKAVSLYSTSDTTKEYYKKLVNTAYSNWTYNTTDFGTYNTNHVGSSVYVEFDAEDLGSGVNSFIVKETLIKTDEGIAGGGISTTSKPQPASKSEETGRLGATYTLGTSIDGIVKLEFFARDNSGNISNNSIPFYVLKDTTIKDDSIDFENNNSDLFIPVQGGSFLVTPEERFAYVSELNNSVNGNTQTVSLKIKENTSDIYYYDSTQMNSSSTLESITAAYTPYNFELYWSYSAEEITTGPITKENGVYTFTRDVDQVVYVKIVTSDSIGNTKEIVKSIAPRLKISHTVDRSIDFENSASLPLMCGENGSNIDMGMVGANMAFYVQYNLTYGSTAKSYAKIVLAFSDILNEIENIDQNPTGTVKVYAIPTFGDISAPKSSNYFEYTIQGWNENPGNGASDIGEVNLDIGSSPIPVFGKTKISDALPSSENAAAEYGPISEKCTVKVTPLPKTKLCKIEVSNYIRNGFNEADYIFKFYQIEVTQNSGEEGYNVSDIEHHIVSSSPVFYTPASEQPEHSVGFGILIEAYSLSEKKWYRPKPFLEKPESSPDGQEQTIPEAIIANAFLCDLYKLDYDFMNPMINTGWFSNGTYGYNSLFMKGGFYIYGGISDNHGNLDKQSTLSYYIIPNSDTKASNDSRDFTLEDLETYYSAYKKTMYYKPVTYGTDEYVTDAERVIGVPFGNTENGYYTIVVAAADKMGNTAIYPTPALILDKGELPWKCERLNIAENQEGAAIQSVLNEWKFTLNTKNNPEITITEIENQEYGFTQTISSVITYMDRIRKYPDSYSYPWEEMPTTLLDNWISEDCFEKHTSGNKTYYTITSSQNPLDADDYDWSSWVRLRSYIQFQNSNPNETDDEWSNKGYYDFSYFYCGTNDTICYSKNCVEGINGIQVFSDRPVFAHTMYSDEPLTNSKFEDNALRIWENKGVETGARVVNQKINEDNSHFDYTYSLIEPYNNGGDPYGDPYGDPENNGENPETPVQTADNFNSDEWHVIGSETYGNENLNAVPKGFWYTTIFHFADGSTAMTDIRQKQ